MDGIVALIAAALMLMLVWRNVSFLRLGAGQKLGMVLIWGAIFALIAVMAAHFEL